MPRVVPGGELNRSTEAGALDDQLQMPNDRVAKFKADVRALVETEQVARLIAEAVLAKVLVEPVAQVEVPAVNRQPERCRQIHEDEIRLGEIEGRVVVRFLRASRRGGENDADQ